MVTAVFQHSVQQSSVHQRRTIDDRQELVLLLAMCSGILLTGIVGGALLVGIVSAGALMIGSQATQIYGSPLGVRRALLIGLGHTLAVVLFAVGSAA